MGFSESPLLSKVALFVLPVGCLFVIIGTATNSWYSYSLDALGISQSTTSGLWKGCVDSTCVSFNGEIPDYLKATRAFAILSILIAVGGTAIIVVAILKNESKPLQILAIVLPAVSAYIHATRAFVILSILLAAGGTTVMVLAVMKNEYKPLQIFAIMAPASAALCAFIAVAVYGGEYENSTPALVKPFIKLSWSFALTVVGGFIDAFSAVLFSISFFRS